MFRICQIVFVFFFALNRASSNAQHKTSITVYYESKCPDSREFIEDQLQPTLNLLHKYLTLRLVPFGKARSINNGQNGFECQHGPTECAGNMVQSCALDLMQERSDVEKVSYVVCEMRTRAGTRGDMQCVIKAGIRPYDVKQCINSGRGTYLQLEEERITKQLRPTFIPTITIHGVFNQQVQDSSLEDLTGTLCTILTGIPPCAEFHNSMALRYLFFLNK